MYGARSPSYRLWVIKGGHAGVGPVGLRSPPPQHHSLCRSTREGVTCFRLRPGYGRGLHTRQGWGGITDGALVEGSENSTGR